jgi:rod shape-determining protein MreD
METRTLGNIGMFIGLFLTQSLIFNDLNLGPYIYLFPIVLYIILYPISENRTGILISSFLLGLLLDFYNNSGGIYAMSMALIAYFRLPLLRFLNSSSELDYSNMQIRQLPTSNAFAYTLIIHLLFTLSLFSLSYFSMDFWKIILLKSLLSALLSSLLNAIIIVLFTKPRV